MPRHILYLCLGIKGGEHMPRTGRPIVGKEPKNKQISLRATETTVKKFQECSDITGKTKTDLLEEMVNELHDRVVKQ